MDRMELEKLIHIVSDPYEAANGSHALVVCTEWDEFRVRLQHLVPLLCKLSNYDRIWILRKFWESWRNLRLSSMAATC